MNTDIAFRSIVMAGVAAVAAVVLSACGTQTTDASSPAGSGNQAGGMTAMPGMSQPASQGSASWNKTDVAFVQMMIPDHQMVAKMNALAAQKAASSKLKTLAAQMQDGQAQTVDKLQGWLQAWGQSSGQMAGMTMPGAMTQKDMDMLKSMKGMNFDMMFAQMMIKHHQGSVQMARDEQAKGTSQEAKAMAADMVTTQEKQIAQLRSITQM